MSRTILSLTVAAMLLATSGLAAQSAQSPPGNSSLGRSGSMSGLLQNPRVQRDLGMSRQQCSQLSGTGQGQDQQSSTDMLSQSQMQRLNQLNRQWQVASDGLGMFLFDPQVAEQLDLSDDQMAQIALFEISFRLWSFRFLRSEDFSEEAMDAVSNVRFVADLVIRDVLDDDQQAMLDELLGKPLQEMPAGQNPGGTGSMGGFSGQSQNTDRAGGLFRPGVIIPNRTQSRQ